MATTPTKKPAAKKPVAKKPVAKAATAPKAAVKKAAAKASTTDTLRDSAKSLVGQATNKARETATQGKDKAGSLLDDLSRMVENVAKSIDDSVGASYGDVARKAASSMSGVAGSLKSKEVDDLVEDARKFIREKPAVAIGAAAAVGFILTRLIKAGSEDKEV